jgi:hypothetical protein
MAWTADELYGRDGAFLDGLDERGEAFVVEIPPNAHVWLNNASRFGVENTKTPVKHWDFENFASFWQRPESLYKQAKSSVRRCQDNRHSGETGRRVDQQSGPRSISRWS